MMRPRGCATRPCSSSLEGSNSSSPSAAARPSSPPAPSCRSLAAQAHFLGTLDGRDCYAAPLGKDEPVPAGMKLMPARSLYPLVDEALFGIAGRALAIAEWDVNHRYCGRCGAAHLAGARRARAPLRRLPHALLPAHLPGGHHARAPRRLHAPGPQRPVPRGLLQHARGLRGRGRVPRGDGGARGARGGGGGARRTCATSAASRGPSAARSWWASPPSTPGGDIRVDGQEIAEAAWFTADRLPQLPPAMSIARRLIDTFLAEVKARSP